MDDLVRSQHEECQDLLQLGPAQGEGVTIDVEFEWAEKTDTHGFLRFRSLIASRRPEPLDELASSSREEGR
jgi:hypothetical protein